MWSMEPTPTTGTDSLRLLSTGQPIPLKPLPVRVVGSARLFSFGRLKLVSEDLSVVDTGFGPAETVGGGRSKLKVSFM